MDKKCEWVRARLALWVGDCYGSDSSSENAKSSDLAAEDRLPVEEHLRACDDCRQHQASLESALNTLWASSEQILIDPDTPSLWPLLSQRLADYPLNRQSTQAHLQRASIRPHYSLWALLDGECALRYAWTQDSLKEVLGGTRSACLRYGSRFAVLSAISAVVACLLLIAQAVLGTGSKNTGHSIGSNAAALVDHLDSPSDQGEETSAIVDALDMASAPPDTVAEVDLSRALDTPGSGVDAASSVKNAPKSRWSYDLEHGIPSFPPDGRETKPIY
jgi:hypothetical protein